MQCDILLQQKHLYLPAVAKVAHNSLLPCRNRRSIAYMLLPAAEISRSKQTAGLWLKAGIALAAAWLAAWHRRSTLWPQLYLIAHKMAYLLSPREGILNG